MSIIIPICRESNFKKLLEWMLWNEAILSKTKVSFFHLILWAFEIKNKKGKKKLHIRFAFRAPYLSKNWINKDSKIFFLIILKPLELKWHINYLKKTGVGIVGDCMEI